MPPVLPALPHRQPRALTGEGSAAHQVGVGEVKGGVEHEVGLDDPASLLTDVVEETGTLQRHTALVAVLGKEKQQERVSAAHRLGKKAWEKRRREADVP